jgi:transcription antitermination factor NusG
VIHQREAFRAGETFDPGILAPFGPNVPADLMAEFAAIMLLEPEPEVLREWTARLQRHVTSLIESRWPRGAVSEWYAVKTAPQAERKAAYALSQEGLAVFLPIETDWGTLRGKLDKTRYAYAPLLPGYFFVLIEATDFRRVLEVEGVAGFVDFIDARGETRPFPIPPAAIIEMQADERAGQYDLTRGRNPTKPPPYRPKRGERVQVIAGPYLTYIGQVIAAPKKNRVKVALEDGRTPMLKVSQVAAA